MLEAFNDMFYLSTKRLTDTNTLNGTRCLFNFLTFMKSATEKVNNYLTLIS
jgi:hypothetical protein